MIAPAEAVRRALELRHEPALKDCALAAGRVRIRGELWKVRDAEHLNCRP